MRRYACKKPRPGWGAAPRPQDPSRPRGPSTSASPGRRKGRRYPAKDVDQAKPDLRKRSPPAMRQRVAGGRFISPFEIRRHVSKPVIDRVPGRRPVLVGELYHSSTDVGHAPSFSNKSSSMMSLPMRSSHGLHAVVIAATETADHRSPALASWVWPAGSAPSAELVRARRRDRLVDPRSARRASHARAL